MQQWIDIWLTISSRLIPCLQLVPFGNVLVNLILLRSKYFVAYGTTVTFLKSPVPREVTWCKILFLILKGFICPQRLVLSFHLYMMISKISVSNATHFSYYIQDIYPLKSLYLLQLATSWQTINTKTGQMNSSNFGFILFYFYLFIFFKQLFLSEGFFKVAKILPIVQSYIWT